jgi:hypothetical protein
MALKQYSTTGNIALTLFHFVLLLVGACILWANCHYNQLAQDRLESMRQIEYRMGQMCNETMVSNRKTMGALGIKSGEIK